MSMTGNIFEIKRMAVHDGPGIRTTVFFKGCSLKCIWCHNPEGISAKPQLNFLAHKCVQCRACESVCPIGAHHFEGETHRIDRAACRACGKCVEVCPADAIGIYGKTVTTEELIPELLADKDFYDCSGGGVTLSGGECLCQAEFCAELLKVLKKEGIHTAVDTCGNVPTKAFDQVLDDTDLFLYDVKHMIAAEHEKLTGYSNTLILDNLKYITNCGAKVEIRIPLIPGCNDDDENLYKTGAFLAGLTGITKVKVLPYNPYAHSKYTALDMPYTMPEGTGQTDDEIASAVKILKESGLNAVSGRE